MGARPPQESLLGTQVDKCEGTRARGSGCEQMRDAQAGGAGLEAARGQFLRDGRCRCACHGSRQRQAQQPLDVSVHGNCVGSC